MGKFQGHLCITGTITGDSVKDFPTQYSFMHIFLVLYTGQEFVARRQTCLVLYCGLVARNWGEEDGGKPRTTGAL